MSDMLKVGYKLFIITVIAALGLSLTNLATAGAIEEQKIKAANEARQAVLSGSESFEQMELDNTHSGEGTSIYIDEVYAGKSGDSIVGYTFRILSKGYGGDIEINVGIDTEGKIGAIQIGAHSETPGLGAKIADDKFIGQYKGKTADKALELVKGSASGEAQVEAISGATVSSRAVTEGINKAIEYYNNVLSTGGEAQ